jgi:hypothetical protein
MSVAETGERLEALGATIREWLPGLFEQWCEPEQDWALTPLQRLGYMAKGAICLLLDRDEYRGYAPADESEWMRSEIMVAILNFHRYTNWEFGAAGDFDYFAVGHGVLRGWWYKIGSDGYP